ncbi:T6SS phospholipase effector Tle1-like catalytic domain-containing protein [Thiopseudomonas alkaliphila]|uniref:T6SS phospholipase effector Tle1-like catalytic domain-containing protein n=1 Tax=Thiopseudomonas alkaliphila TaxID=1697053 RepID=UPI00069F1B12|nr:DUF2235 domain-containing protein [Thiopseudomonas alkaliphila]
MDNLFQTHKDALDGMLAAFDDIPNEELSFEQDCHERVKIALFFDGTGNNRDADAPTESWSNVARLYEAARDEPEKGLYRYYISGVGTKLNREEPWWHLNKHPRDSAALGGGTGWGADSRLKSGDIDTNDALTRALKVSAELASDEVQAILEANEKEGFAKLNEALSKHRLIRSIDISVFGFSRGAALARAFVNRLLKACEKEGGELTYEGYPIRFRFLGIFDTVASFGRPAKNDFKKIEMLLPQELEKCVHYVAAHELRYSFPVDLIRQEGAYPREDWIETVFPGVHSDVGGGYRPGAQGKSDELARIPLLNMYVKSLASGARFRDWSEISEDKPLRDKFGLSRGVQSTYKAYMEAVGQQAKTGTIEEQIKAHMEHWYAYMGALESGEAELELDRQEQAHETRIEQLNNAITDLKRKRKRQNPYKDEINELTEQRTQAREDLRALRASRKQIDKGRSTISKEARRLKRKQDANKPLTLGFVAGRYFFRSTAEPWMLNAYLQGSVEPDVARFLDTLVHDSKAGFLGGKEPYAYFRRRGLWESER